MTPAARRTKTEEVCGTSVEEDYDTAREYDFSTMEGGVRGKHCKAYREGHTVSVRKEDGSIERKAFPSEDGRATFKPRGREGSGNDQR